MRVVQFVIPSVALAGGRRVGYVDGDDVVDVTAVDESLTSVFDVFEASQASGTPFDETLSGAGSLDSGGSGDSGRPGNNFSRLDYGELLGAEVGGNSPYLIAPFDHPDDHRLLVSGTGLTHTGSAKSRDQMHSDDDAPSGGPAGGKPPEEPLTDSAKMFQMGIEGGKPEAGERGVSPEWFYKGNGTIVRGPGEGLELPAFALDGGEEPELAGCYFIDKSGMPHRVGFTLGNEWSDHETERVNYLYLAPSKLRSCAIGPELVTDFAFDELALQCTVERDGELIYESGPLYTGEEYMSHTLANCEDHHFKYPLHRVPGDGHIHFFGTSRISYGSRDWKFRAGDVITVSADGFSAALSNSVVGGDAAEGRAVRVVKA
ncbi:MAG: GguC family protein [Chloroflexi bacterium]|nr:GguC family protein [Chloroflexota bacterium]